MIPLDNSIPDDETMLAITGTDMKDKIEEERNKQLILQEKQLKKDIKELHKLSPAEYLEMLKKQQAASGDQKE